MVSGPLQITGLKVNKSQVMVVTFKQTQTRVDNLGKWVYSDIAGRFVNQLGFFGKPVGCGCKKSYKCSDPLTC